MHRYIYINGVETAIYNYFSIGATLVFFLFNYLQFKQKKKSLSRLSLLLLEQPPTNAISRFFKSASFLTAVEIFLLSAQYNMTNLFAPLFAQTIGDNINYFGTLMTIPFLLLLFYCEIGLHPLKHSDLIAPSFPLALIVAKLGCFFAGCCHGYEWEYGLYNMKTQLVEFPVQLVEIAEALFIFVFIIYYRKKAKPGTLLPLFTILYSGLRFFSEFLRGEAEPIFWYIKPYHLFCIIGVIFGVIEYIIAIKYGDKLVEICDNSIIWRSIAKVIIRFRKRILERQKAPTVHHQKKKKKNQKKTAYKK